MQPDIKYIFKRKGKTRKCPYCGQVCQPGGLGGHIRLKHGIKLKTVVSHVPGDISHVPGDIPHVPGDVSHVPHVPHVPDVKVQRPSDYVKKHSKVVNIEAFPVFENNFIGGYCVCTICCKDLKLLKSLYKRAPHLDAINIVCNECLKRYKKEDLHGEQTAVWWHVPDSNNQQLRIDYFYTENKILLSEYFKHLK